MSVPLNRSSRVESTKQTFKLVVVGDQSVGKSSVLRCIDTGASAGNSSGQKSVSPLHSPKSSVRKLQVESVSTNVTSSLRVNPAKSKPVGFIKKDIKIDRKKIELEVELEIWNGGVAWETAEIQQDPDTHYKDANGVIVVYDVTNQKSFENVKQKWVKEINSYASPTVSVMILGNKSDCSSRVVSTKAGRSYATKQGLQFIETSAQNNENVNEAIERMAKIMVGPVIKDEDFLKAVNKGKGKLTQLNIILHGPPGVGKTSLKQIILGLPPLSKHERNSTDVLENAVRAIAIDRANSFKEISNQELITLLADTLADQIRQQAESPPLPVTPQPQQPTSSGASWGEYIKRFLWSRSQAVLKEDPTADSSNITSELENDDEFEVEDIDMTKARNIRLLHDEIVFAKPSSSMFESTWHHLIDSGGQPQFQDMLPLVYHSPSFQIVLMRLTERLHEKPKMQYTVEGENAIESPEDLPLTNFQYIERACQIAASCDPPSKVMIVGTHKDQLGPADDDNSKAVIATINGGLVELCKRYKDVVIPKSNHETIFDMNAMAVGEEREKYMNKLQAMISGVSSKWAKPEDVKLKWLCFHLAIDKEEGGVVKYRDCVTVGKSLGMGSDSVARALKYFSNTGLLLYYKEQMPELVLTKVNPLVDRLSELIKASLFPPPLLKKECDDFKQCGTFNKAFIDDLFKEDSPMVTEGLNNTQFLRLLLYLKLAVEIAPDEYFIPSALSFYSAERSVPLHFNESCGFALEYDQKKRILPHGFFFTTAVELQNTSSSRFNFKFQRQPNNSHFKFELRKDDQQYRDRIQFHDKKRSITDLVILTDQKWWIQVTVANDKERPAPKDLQEVRRAVKNAITQALDSLKLSQYSIKKVFPCPEKGHTDHYCMLIKKKTKYECSISLVMTGPGDRFHCWSGKPYTEPPLIIEPIQPQPSIEDPSTDGPPNSLPSPVIAVPTPPLPQPPSVVWPDNTQPPVVRPDTQPPVVRPDTQPPVVWPDTQPTHKNIFDVLKPISSQWYDIAIQFEIDYNTRQGILSNKQDDSRRLDAAINAWIERDRPPVTWDTLHKIMVDMKNHHIAKQLVSNYGQ